MGNRWVTPCVAIGLVAGLLGTSGCGAGEGSSEEVTLGAVLPVTGPAEEYGRGNKAILEMLEEEVNGEGGIRGKKLRIVIYDTGAQPQEAANLISRVATDDAALAVLGPFTSSEAEVVFPVCNRTQIACTSHASSKPGIAEANRPWTFRNTVTEDIYIKASLQALQNEQQVQSAAIAYDAADAVSTSIGEEILPGLFEAGGIGVVGGSITFSTEDVDVAAPVSKLASADPDAVGLGAFGTAAVNFVKQMERRGLEIPIVGGSTLVSTELLEAAPTVPIYAAGTYFPGAEEASDWTERARRAYEDAGLEGEPNVFDAQIYEAGRMYVEAIKSKNLASADMDLEAKRVAIREFMAGLTDFPSLLGGDISFQSSGDAARDAVVILGQNGEWKKITDIAPQVKGAQR